LGKKEKNKKNKKEKQLGAFFPGPEARHALLAVLGMTFVADRYN
jgi:hypothetical protein